MSVVVAEQELFKACQILFGGELDVSREFLEYLQPSGIKSAYRQKARETHPDLALLKGGLIERRRADMFQAVQQAYENLTQYLVARENGFRLSSSGQIIVNNSRYAQAGSSPAAQANSSFRNNGGYPRSTSSSTRNGESSRYKRNNETPSGDGRNGRFSAKQDYFTGVLYQGPMPHRKLLFGHFMYYSGLIDWRTIVKALVWQRSQRPRLGEIGCRLGWLTEEDVLVILRNRGFLELFGQSAINHKLLNKKQLSVLVEQQKILQKKFGEFFVANNIFTPRQLQDVLNKYNLHNSRVAMSSFNQDFR
ncbi:MAG: molecular chaperone DnaJ [Proteobacteria bacterium]|nr:molecular chaperone DnaJ [Pseudomonadota bacterium]MBU1715324.1 molecular chaperone DnaJ [Pseudomonadota bacterium]